LTVRARRGIEGRVAVLALAYVMNFSGQTVTLGLALAGTGGFFAFLSPVVGWIGVAVTGSDTSATSLFGRCVLVYLQSTPVLGWMVVS
jgi:lactate permease